MRDRPRGASGREGDGGQAAVELALVLPLVFLLLLVVVQVGLVARDQVLVVHATREAARQAAVDPAPDAARKAALAGSHLAPGRLTVDVRNRAGPGSRVSVRVEYRTPTDIPLVGALVHDLTLSSSASMRVEQ